jgi:hypothetical protein
VAQGVDPEFKPQCYKNKRKKERKKEVTELKRKKGKVTPTLTLCCSEIVGEI